MSFDSPIRKVFGVLCCVCVGNAAAYAQTTWYVDDDGEPGANCMNWDNACPDLHIALLLASSGDQIWVAAGTYKPTSGTDRTATFQLESGVAVYGGFDGTESTLAERAGLFDQTFVSGDIGTLADNTDNSYHVVTGSGTDATAVLDGFTITAGNADGVYPESHGAGMYNDNGSPTVTNCAFSYNAAYVGGAMANEYYSAPTITDCTFNGNSAFNNGGGIASLSLSAPTMIRCTFNGDTAGSMGGGMMNNNSTVTAANCTFNGNSAVGNGGGVNNNYLAAAAFTDCTFTGNDSASGGAILNWADLTLTNCTFIGNSASARGGGLLDTGAYSTGATMINCTFAGNFSPSGGAVCADSDPGPTIINAIVWENSFDEISVSDGMPSVTYSDVQGGFAGDGNIDDDPMFVRNPDDGGDGWGDDPATTEVDEGANDDCGDLHLRETSPCIDAGDNEAVTEATDLDGNPRIIDGDGDGTATVDMGAYEYSAGAPPAPLAPDPDPFASQVDKNRYISMVIPTEVVASNAETAIRVRLALLHDPPEPVPDGAPDFGAWEGNYRWVNSLSETHTCPDNVTHGTTISCAVLGCEPEYRAWAKELGGEVLHVSGAAVVPSSVYHVAQLAASCAGNEAACAAVSDELSIVTSQHGDVAPVVPGETFWEGLGVLDSARIVDHLKGRDYPTMWPPEAGTAMNKPRLHLRPNLPDTLGTYLGVLDVAVCVDAIKGKAYKHFGAFGPCTDCCAGEAPCPYPNALCCDDPACCEKDEAEDMPPECNP